MIAKPGEEIDAWCTKCKMDLAHRIVAVLAARPKRVECLTCHSQHNFRKPKGAGDDDSLPRTRPAAAKGKRMTKSAAEALEQWEQHVRGKPEGAFARYSVKQQFTAEQLLIHVKFGQGFVSEVLEDNKINVIFRDGPKILAHARG